MSFFSLQFFVFLVVLFFLLNVITSEKIKLVVLLLASYVFYAYWDWRFLVVLVSETAVAYVGAKCAEKKNGWILWLTLAFELCVLIAGRELYRLDIGIPQVIGISFYTLQSISYIIDVKRGKTSKDTRLVHAALYIGFFPQIISGPIMKSYELIPQFQMNKRINPADVKTGVLQFLQGCVKKYVLADRLAVCVDAVYTAPNAYSRISVLIAVLAYSLQLYFDFSGYSDMAIGVARMLGYDFGKNFDAPYISRDLSEFWKRWHISLSSWLKEYVYIPLGGSRKGLRRTSINLLLVMLISGLWHGFALTFLLWGALHGIGLVINKRVKSRCPHGFQTIVTYLFVTACWIPFRASSIQNMCDVLKAMVIPHLGIGYVYTYALIIFVIVLVWHVMVDKGVLAADAFVGMDFSRISSWLVFWCAIFLLLGFSYEGGNQFIYSQF